MAVLLAWNDHNPRKGGHKIYRSTSPMNPGNMPAPLAVLGPGNNYYDDTTTDPAVTYYYRVGTFLGSDEELSAEVSTEG
jgi:hypothetical protein